jgi:hypothetical protein
VSEAGSPAPTAADWSTLAVALCRRRRSICSSGRRFCSAFLRGNGSYS